MLAVVEHEQHVALPQRVDQLTRHVSRTFGPHVERRRDSGRHQLGIAHRGQLDEPDPVARAADDMLGYPQREARLAAAARARQGDEPLPLQQRAHCTRLGLAAHEAREVRGQVVERAIDRPKWTSDILQAGAAYVEHLLEPPEVLQPMLTQVAEPDPGWDVLAESKSCRRRHEHLATVANCHQSCNPIDGRPEEVIVPSCALTRMDCHPRPDWDGWRPWFLLQRELCRGRGAYAVGRRLEHRTERVTDGLEDDTTATFNGTMQQRVVARERHFHRVGVVFPHPSAVLDVREQERHDGPHGHRKSLHHRQLGRSAG